MHEHNVAAGCRKRAIHNVVYNYILTLRIRIVMSTAGIKFCFHSLIPRSFLLNLSLSLNLDICIVFVHIEYMVEILNLRLLPMHYCLS